MLAPAPGGGCLSQGHGPGTTAGPGPARGRAGGQAAMAAVRAPPGRNPRGRRRALAVRSGPGWARLPVPASLTATPAASLPPHHMAGSPQRRPRFLPGTRHALRREEGRGGACGDTWVTGPGGGHLKVLRAASWKVCALGTREGLGAGRRTGLTGWPPRHRPRVSASIFCSPWKLSGSWSCATPCRMATSGPPPYRSCR